MWWTLSGTGSLSVTGCCGETERKEGGREGEREGTYDSCLFTDNRHVWPPVFVKQ